MTAAQRRPAPHDASAERWTALHHGIDPARVPLLLPWLRLLWRLARPLRAVPPTVITVLGVLLALDAVLLAGSLPGAAAGAVVLAAVCDGLDGAVAVVADRATSGGAVADAVADRISDVAFAAVLWRCGAPWALAVACGVLAVGVDVLRRVRRVPAVITVGERATWTVCAVLAAGCAAITDAEWPATVCGAVWAAAGVVALGQIGRPFHASRPARRSRHDAAVR
ncbi:MAG: archaetidylinositol phosphate synthase [Pseudonocardiales bacterium]|jgi:CDP-diacylglycerol--glycerol-3-phosphate 3-phosphatidyltransferase|nr:archaetidylinositol phosphate synthase [Pseudonocardiales bacterium]